MATLIARSCRFRQVLSLRQVNSAVPAILNLPANKIIDSYSFSSLKPGFEIPAQKCQTHYLMRFMSKSKDTESIKSETEDDTENRAVKLSLFQRFKQMYKDYWYVLVPVHLITSAGWMGSFYYMAKSGIDVVAIMESYNISERITSPLKDSTLGYFAISYAMYKIATPIRYTVTLGGTTISINYLQKWGYIKPVPTREQLKEIYKEKKDTIMDSMKDKREELRLRKEQLRDRTDNLIDDMEKKIIHKINDTKKKTTPSTFEKP